METGNGRKDRKWYRNADRTQASGQNGKTMRTVVRYARARIEEIGTML